MCQFLLGTHQPEWSERTGVHLFLSARRLRKRKRLPRAMCPWSLDSGGFSEIKLHGTWQTTPQQYLAEVRRWRDEVGNLQWAAVQDWMCEPFMLRKTGKTVVEHQRRTTWSYLTLKSLAPEVWWVPVLQGWTIDDYLRHLEEYHRALPFPLSGFRLVGVGSVCRRQGTSEALEIFQAISLECPGIRLHGFGLKTLGLERCAPYLASADSMAWSARARRAYHHDRIRLCGDKHKGGCANCLPWALSWREKVVRLIERVKKRPFQKTFC